MPQFDKITFFNQVFWLFVFFSASYIVFLKVFLPKLAQLMKARTKISSKGTTQVDKFITEQHDTSSFFNSSVEKLMISVKEDVISSKSNLSAWVELNKLGLNKEKLNKSNSLLEKAIYKQGVLDYLLSKNK